MFIMLFSFISKVTSSRTEENAVNNMKVVAPDRSDETANMVPATKR